MSNLTEVDYNGGKLLVDENQKPKAGEIGYFPDLNIVAQPDTVDDGTYYKIIAQTYDCGIIGVPFVELEDEERERGITINGVGAKEFTEADAINCIKQGIIIGSREKGGRKPFSEYQQKFQAIITSLRPKKPVSYTMVMEKTFDPMRGFMPGDIPETYTKVIDGKTVTFIKVKANYE